MENSINKLNYSKSFKPHSSNLQRQLKLIYKWPTPSYKYSVRYNKILLKPQIMGSSHMKSLIFCLLLVSMVALNHGVAARRIPIRVLDPCRNPFGRRLLPGCLPDGLLLTSPYKRGCSIIHRCYGLGRR